MSLWSSCKLAFRRVGIMLRDHELRLQALEKRTVSLYPVVKFSTMSGGQTFPDQEVYRADGTLALKMNFIQPALTTGFPPGIVGTNAGNTIASIQVRVYGIDGVTVVQSYNLKMDSNETTVGNTRGLINGSSIQ